MEAQEIMHLASLLFTVFAFGALAAIAFVIHQTSKENKEMDSRKAKAKLLAGKPVPSRKTF